MNKNVLKNFAINARLELLARVRDRATLYGITDEKVKNNQIVASNAFQKIDGQLLSKNEIAQRNALLQRIQNNGYVQVMEEAAYTWFNRFIALKYMEVHKLLPVDQHVIPQQAGELPQLVREAQNVTLGNIDFDTVAQYLDNNRTEELYKYLVISLCNQLSGCLPQMFEKISDYTELLFPDGLMKADSFLGMLANVDDENWQEIQVIGWLYQYYNTDLKNETFDLLKKNIKITKDRIGAATQVFTPEWIVRYMVENSLGRLWYEGHPDDNLKTKWRYYLDESKQETSVETQFLEIQKEREKLQLEEIKLIDPCMGSGHILVYSFDVLLDIYRSVGYTDRDAVQSIIQNNIYGLDIDDRAAQLAYFALMMKAAEYDKRFLKRGIQPNVYAIQESNTLSEFAILHGQMSLDKLCINTSNHLISEFVNAKVYGSILTPKIDDLINVNYLMEQLKDAAVKDLEFSAWYEKAEKLLPQLANQALILQQQYDVVITNPPYMGANNMEPKMASWIKDKYPDSKSDLSTVFMERAAKLCKADGYYSMINIPVWMFLGSYELLRKKLIDDNQFINLLHLGRGVFGADFGTTSFVIRKGHIRKYISCFKKLYERQGTVDSLEKKIEMFFSNEGTYYRSQDDFITVPGYCIAYAASSGLLYAFAHGTRIDSFAEPKQGLATADNNKFLRLWFEPSYTNVIFNCQSHDQSMNSHEKWYPYNKGGGYKKWYGNNEYLINWESDGKELRAFKGSVIRSPQYYFKKCLSWCKVTISGFSMRYIPSGFLFDVAGCSLFADDDQLLYVLAFANSCVNAKILSIISPTVNYEVGHIASLPILYASTETTKQCIRLAQNNIDISKEDWDSFEVSWDFKHHPLVFDIKLKAEYENSQWATDRLAKCSSLQWLYEKWNSECESRFQHMKENEKELNRLFIDVYGLGEELTPEVADKDITVRKSDLCRDIRSLISYAVGCMFGRYSLDVPGLAYAGGDWDSSKYMTYPADRDGILPITDDEYFQDDIVSMFVRWVKTVYGEETLEENLQFIANALNPNGGTSREVIRAYFLNDFYADHLKIYQKRPIYWQFDSGKQNGFKALMYLHRYDQDTIARLRTDYVHELQDRYRTQLEDARKTAESGDARQRSIANKRAQKLDKQLVELNKYEELVHHYADMRISLDLDDGVKVNYAKLQDILTKIK